MTNLRRQLPQHNEVVEYKRLYTPTLFSPLRTPSIHLYYDTSLP